MYILKYSLKKCNNALLNSVPQRWAKHPTHGMFYFKHQSSGKYILQLYNIGEKFIGDVGVLALTMDRGEWLALPSSL